jgi:ubiquinone/menaquinone biosynthesis C-methylase UbiE
MLDDLPKVFFEVHRDLPREGPGDNESTTKAYQTLTALPQKPRILDVGCGPGMQTVQLAKLTDGRITAVDFYQPFLDQLAKKAQKEGVADRIQPVKGDMFNLNFAPGSFDLVWSEGAIYIIGFEKALNEWKRFLSPNGYLVASHISWLKPNPPQEPRKFWQDNYPNIKTIEENLQVAENAGYHVVNYFVLPKESWFLNYYNPIEAKLPSLRSKYRGDAEALRYLDSEQFEIDLCRKFSAYYGYVFFILQVQG